MRIIVQKYGGSSLATVDQIKDVARRVVEKKAGGFRVVVVVSAMGDTTDDLMQLARQVVRDPARRELDILLATGELTSAALLSMAIQGLGEPATSLSGGLSGIVTNDVHCNARILEIRPERILKELAEDRIVVAAGFQGVSREREVTTLGRGGSDLTASALAAALGAECCEILTDVEGVYSSDPRVVPEARLLERASYGFIEELAWHGARVLKDEAVELGRDHDVSLRVGSAGGGELGTVIENDAEGLVFTPRRSEYTGVSGRKDLVRLSYDSSRLSAAALAELFAVIAEYDLVFGDVHGGGPHVLFLSTEEMPGRGSFAAELEERFSRRVEVSEALGAVTLVGFGLGSRPAALRDAMCRLEEEGVDVSASFTSRESLTYVVRVAKVDHGMRVLHRHFVEQREAPVPRALAVTGQDGNSGIG